MENLDFRGTANFADIYRELDRLEQRVSRASSALTASPELRIKTTRALSDLAAVESRFAALRTSLNQGISNLGTNTLRLTVGLATGQAGALRSQLNALGLTLPVRLETANVQGDVNRIRTLLNGVTTTLPLRLDLTQVQADLTTLRSQLTAASTTFASLVRIDATALQTVSAQIATQITQLNALIQQLRSLGGSGGGAGGGAGAGGSRGVSAANRQLLDELQRLTNAYQRGQIGATQYEAQLRTLRTSLSAAFAGAAQGSADFRALDRALTQLTANLRRVNSDSITRIRSEITAARAAFDAASASATNFAQRRAAVAQFQSEITRLTGSLQGLVQNGRLTAQQLTQVNGLLGQLARTSNTVNGGVNVAGLSGNLLNALRQISQFVPAVGAATGAVSGFTAGLAGVSGAAAAALAGVTALTAGVAASLAQFAQFEVALQGAKATLGLFGEAGRDIGNQLEALAQSDGVIALGVNSTKAAGAIEELGSRGLNTSEILGGGLNTAAKLAAAAGVKDLNVAAEALVGTMKVFNLEGAEAAKIPDVLSAAANVSALRLEDFRLALAAGGSAAKASGTTLSQFTTIISLMRDNLISASDAGTSFKTFIGALTANSPAAKQAFKDLGVEAFDANGKMRDLFLIIGDLAKATANLTDQDRLTKLETIFGSDGIRAATIAIDAYNQKIGENGNLLAQREQDVLKTGLADQAAKERLDTLTGAFDELKNTLTAVAQQVGASLAPAVTDLLKTITELVRGVRDLTKDLPNLAGYIVPVVVALAAWKTQAVLATLATIPLTSATIIAGFTALRTAVMGVVTTLITGFVPAMVAARTAALAFLSSNAIGLILTAVAAAAVALNKFLADTEKVKQASFEATQNTSNQITDRARELLKAGGELNRARAALLLNIDMRGDAALRGDSEAVKKYEANIKRLQAEVKALQMEEDRRGQISASASAKSAKAVKLDTEERKKQLEVLKEIRAELSKREANIKLLDATSFKKELAQIEADFNAFRLKAKADVKDPAELQKILKEISAGQGAAQNAALQQQLRADKDARLQIERELQAGRVALMQDGAVKRKAELQKELDDIRARFGPQIREALQNAGAVRGPQKQQFLAGAAELQRQQAEAERQARAASAKADAEALKREQETQARRVQAVKDAQRALLSSQASNAEAYLGLLEQQQARELEVYGRTASERLDILKRNAPALLAAQQASIDARFRSERAAADAELQASLRDAQDAGEQRAALEAAAREKYGLRLRELDLNQTTETNAARLNLTRAFEAERAKIAEEGLQKELKNIEKLTGVQLSAYRQTLEARLATAQATPEGSVEVGPLRDALKSLDDLQATRLDEFRQGLRDTGEALGELNGEFKNLDATPLTRAIQTATSGVDAIIKRAQDARRDSTARFNALSLEQQGQERTTYEREQAALSAIIKRAETERFAIKTRASQDFQRQEADRITQQGLTTARGLQEQGVLTRKMYDDLLAEAQIYYGNVARNAVAGSEAQLNAFTRLRELGQERARLAGEEKAQLQDNRALEREKIEAALKLAKTDAERTRIRAQLTRFDQDELAAVDRQLAALGKGKEQDAERNRLTRERLAILERINATAGDESQQGEAAREKAEEERRKAAEEAKKAAEEAKKAAEDLINSQVALRDAEIAYAAEVAKTDAQVRASRQSAMSATAQNIARIDEEIVAAKARNASETEINNLLVERQRQQTTLAQQARDLARLPLDVAEQQQNVLQSEVALRAQLAGLADDALTQARLSLQSTQDDIRALQARLDLQGEGALKEDERRTAQVKMNELLTREDQQRRAISAAIRNQVSEARQLLEAQEALGRALGGQDGAGSTAAAEVGNIRRQIADTNRALQDQNTENIGSNRKGGRPWKFHSLQNEMAA